VGLKTHHKIICGGLLLAGACRLDRSGPEQHALWVVDGVGVAVSGVFDHRLFVKTFGPRRARAPRRANVRACGACDRSVPVAAPGAGSGRRRPGRGRERCAGETMGCRPTPRAGFLRGGGQPGPTPLPSPEHREPEVRRGTVLGCAVSSRRAHDAHSGAAGPAMAGAEVGAGPYRPLRRSPPTLSSSSTRSAGPTGRGLPGSTRGRPDPDTTAALVGSEAEGSDWGAGDGLAQTLPLVEGHQAGHGTEMAMLMAAPQNGWGMVGDRADVRPRSRFGWCRGETGFPFSAYSYGISRCPN